MARTLHGEGAKREEGLKEGDGTLEGVCCVGCLVMEVIGYRWDSEDAGEHPLVSNALGADHDIRYKQA